MQAQHIADKIVKTLERMRSDDSFQFVLNNWKASENYDH